jgi:hypothetical protein
MEFYPLGSLPTSYPSWYVDALAGAGMNAYASATWILSANDEERFSSPAAHLLPMPPGYRLFRHGHPCYRFEIVVQGSLELGDGRIAGVGDVFTAEPGTLYGPHTAGPEGCTTIEFFSRLEAAYTLLYEGPDGEILEADVRKGEMPPDYIPMERDSDMLPGITQTRGTGVPGAR